VNNEVLHSSFKTSRIGALAGFAALAIFGVFLAGFFGHKGYQTEAVAVPPVEPVAQTSVCEASDTYCDPVNRSVRGTDLYLVAAHNLAEGQVLSPKDLKVVKMPGLHGYELAFSKPYPIVGMKLSHALPEGQPVLPYHVQGSLAERSYSDHSQEEHAR